MSSLKQWPYLPTTIRHKGKELLWREKTRKLCKGTWMDFTTFAVTSSDSRWIPIKERLIKRWKTLSKRSGLKWCSNMSKETKRMLAVVGEKYLWQRSIPTFYYEDNANCSGFSFQFQYNFFRWHNLKIVSKNITSFLFWYKVSRT